MGENIKRVNEAFVPSGAGIVEFKLEKEGQETTLKMDIPEVPKFQFQKDMWDIIDKFETDSWKESRGGLDTGFNSLNEAFDGGIKPGFVIVPADSNVGKTIFLSQLLYNIAHKNDNTYVMDFSLDDPMDDKIPRIVACDTKIPIGIIKNPRQSIDHEETLARRIHGINKLRKAIDKYRIYDSNFTSYIEDIDAEIQNVKMAFAEEGRDDVNIVVGIDNFHDLNIKSGRQEQKFDLLASYCADLAIKHNIVLICSAELRKVNGNHRPTLDSIRDSVKIKYEAKAVLLCHNDVHYNGDGANVFFERDSKPGKQPVLEVHVAKNKMGSYKGRIFFEQYPEMSRLVEVSSERAKEYSMAMYS